MASHGGGIQEFIDGVHGDFFATMLHWVGALAFTGGVVLLGIFLAQRRRDPSLAERSPVLPAVLLVGGIVLNLVGGFMRLWESDHPGLGDVAHSRWVQALAAKHTALVLGMGASVLLLVASFPAARRRLAVLSRLLAPSRTEAFLATAFLSVAVATIIGALVTSIVTPTGAEGADAQAFAELAPEDLAIERVALLNYTGSITASPVQPGRAEHALAIPLGTSDLRAALTWQGAASVLDVALLDPSGNEAEAEKTATATGVELALEAPAPGGWTLVVTSERALAEAYRVEVQMDVVRRATGRYEQTIAVSPDAPAEIELEVEPQGWVRYDFYGLDGAVVTLEAHDDDTGTDAATDADGSGRLDSAASKHYGFVLRAEAPGRAAVRLVGPFAILSAPGAAPAAEMGDGHAHG